MSLKYRPEIDGLRAIAVLSVILFHLQVAGFAGGFVGVDVFFVISGYLITGIILQDYNAGWFTFADFYKRRIRRIIPLTVVVYAFTLLVSYFLFFSEQYASINHVLKSSLVFVSNFLLLRKPGYFDPSTQENPFLHTWSLSVEEQFYIFFPLIIYTLLRYASDKWKRGLVLIAILSFAVNILVVSYSTQKAFYWPHTRAWQLLCGALLATGIIKSASKQWLNNLLSVAGILMVLTAVVLYQENTQYPGWYALLPVAGACCIIYSTVNGTLAHRLLASRPMVFVGKISYSLYMWHWPFWAFASFLVIGPLSIAQKAILIVVTFIVSYVSYRLIEQPFRSKKAAANKFTVWGIMGSSALLMVLALLFINNHDGIGKKEWKAYEQDLYSNGDKMWEKLRSLETANMKDYTKISASAIGVADSTSSFLLLGDSHARALAAGVDALAKETGKTGMVLCASSCPPVCGLRYKVDASHLQPFMENSMLFIQRHPEIRIVVLSARWSSYFDTQMRFERTLVPLDNNVTITSQQELLWHGLEQTILQLQAMGKTVKLIGPIPELKATVNEMLIAQKLFGVPRQACSPTEVEFTAKNKELLDELKVLAKRNNVQLISVADSFFADSPYMQGTTSVYRDKNHLSEKASCVAAGNIIPLLK